MGMNYRLLFLTIVLAQIMPIVGFSKEVSAAGITKVEQQINLLTQEYSTTTSSQPGDNSLGLILWEPDKYTGETVYFEAIIRCDTCSGGNNQVTAQLETDTGSAVTGSTVTTSAGTYTLVRSGNITSNLTSSEEYTVSLTRDATAGTAYMLTARIIVLQSAALITDTLTQVEIGAVDQSTSTSYARLNASPIYLWDEAVHSDLSAVYLESSLVSSTAGTNAYAALSSSSNCSSTVTDSEVSVAGTSWDRSRSSNIATNLSDNTEYWLCIKAASGETASISSAKLIIEQQNTSDGIQFLETYHQYINQATTDSDSTYTSYNFMNTFDPANFTADIVNYYYEATFSTSSGTGYAQLYDLDGAAAISSSEISTTDTGYDRKRSAEIGDNLPGSSSDLDTEIKNSASNTTSIASSWLIIQLDDILDPSLSFSIAGTSAGNTYNSITTSVDTTYNNLNFGNLTFGVPKYAAHMLSATSNAPGGYSVTMKLDSFMQGLYPGNDIDPFPGSWDMPTTWTEPTGTTENIDTGWIGANTTDTRISAWASGSEKFGAVNNSAHQVMYATAADSGSTVYVTYAIEVNILQPADLYSGTITYNFLPTY
jgi:hypothetical protein